MEALAFQWFTVLVVALLFVRVTYNGAVSPPAGLPPWRLAVFQFFNGLGFTGAISILFRLCWRGRFLGSISRAELRSWMFVTVPSVAVAFAAVVANDIWATLAIVIMPFFFLLTFRVLAVQRRGSPQAPGKGL